MRRTLPLLLLSLAACAGGPSPKPESAAAARIDPAWRRYFPLAVGNSWTYLTRFAGREERNTVEIVSEEGGFYRDNQRGLLAWDAEGLRDERRYLIHAPVVEGERWQSVLEAAPGKPGVTEEYRILSTDETVTVPAGTFQDVVLVQGVTPVDAATKLEVVWAYAPEVGLVRMESTAVIGGRERVPQATIELASYDLKPSGG